MSVKSIERELYEKSPGKNMAPGYKFSYYGNDLTVIETRSVQCESDYTNEAYTRISHDNRKSWSSWKDTIEAGIQPKDNGEIMWIDPFADVLYNPVHNHYVSMVMQRLFPRGHEEYYKLLWAGGAGCIDHTFIHVSTDLETWNELELVTYEDGADYDDENWLNPDYTQNNLAYCGCNMEILENGDILFPIGARVTSCCAILGIEAADIFPSCPHIVNGLIVVRGIWNRESNRYDFVSSKPVVISDLKSSRGVDEPTIIQLKNGRIVVVFRGANTNMPAWNTRLEPGTPAYKWYTYSDDGGKTFSDPVPYRFDNGEPVYSPASISLFLRSIKDGKSYWIGNVTPSDTKGSFPREPLSIAEVDEESGFLKKDTYAVIGQRDPEVESDQVQLSNFSIFQDRETKRLELYLTKVGSNKEEVFSADAWKYTITFE